VYSHYIISREPGSLSAVCLGTSHSVFWSNLTIHTGWFTFLCVIYSALGSVMSVTCVCSHDVQFIGIVVLKVLLLVIEVVALTVLLVSLASLHLESC
jgi:hypothetical protein